MKHAALLTIALLLAATAPADAGEPGYKKCSLDTQTCLNQMIAKLKGRGWLGIEYDFDKGSNVPKVIRIVPGSPAEASGFRIGDLLISVNGAKFADNTEDKCATCEATKEIWKPGAKVRYIVRRKGKEIRLAPTLAELPTDVMAQMIGMHMLEHAQPVTEAAKK
jgi:C-terminal processing protease CtpA/Prc